MEYHIKDREWEVIFEKLHEVKGIHLKNKFGTRRFIEGVWYIARSGCQWRLLPSVYGHWRAVHMRFKSWSKEGVWELLFKVIVDQPDMGSIMIDTTVVRAHACSAGYKKDNKDVECLGRSKGGFTTKIHAVVDGLGNPLKFILTAGQRNDVTQAENLIASFKNTTVIADKGYDSNSLIRIIKGCNSNAVIPPRKNRKTQREYDSHTYKERHLIECFFGKIKHFRRIFSRSDKTAEAFLGFLNFVAVLIWL